MTVAQLTPSSLMTPDDIDLELDRQLGRILAANLHQHVGWTPEEAATYGDALREPLRAKAVGLPRPTRERAPFVLVMAALPPSIAITTQRHGTKSGFLSGDTSDIDEFRPIDGLDTPHGLYAVVDVWRGQEHLGRTPDEAMSDFERQGRSPLTVTEGLALLTAHPEALEKNHCFQTPGSRNGDRRVPGLWISKGAPKLGFCWAGNRHTWLGIASCAGRVSA